MIWITFFIAVMILVPVVRELRRIPVKHKQLPPLGEIAQLSNGKTHYQWIGPDDGPLIVCVHGLTTPSFVWAEIATALAANGARVLTYDLYGRGYSDRPTGVQDAEFFIRQIKELLDDQGIKQPFTLIGYSMGGIIAPAFAARYPERIRGLAIIAPAGMGHDLGTLCAVSARLPVIGDWCMHLFYPRAHRRGARADTEAAPEFVAEQINELATRGFVRSVLASLRGVLNQDTKPVHEKIARHRIPMLAIWAEADSVIPLKGHEILSTWNPSADQRIIPAAGHGVAHTHAHEIVSHLSDWHASVSQDR